MIILKYMWITRGLISWTSFPMKQCHMCRLHYFTPSVLWLSLVLSPAALIINGSWCHCSVDLSSSCSEWGWGPSRGPVTWFGMGPHHLLRVAFGFDQENVTLGQKNAGQQAKAGGQDGKNLDGNHELAACAEVRRNKGDPHDEKDQHAEGHTFPLTGRQSKKHASCLWSVEVLCTATEALMHQMSKVVWKKGNKWKLNYECTCLLLYTY